MGRTWWGGGGGADPGGEVEVGRTLVGRWRWGGPWWGGGEVGRTLVGRWRGGADPGGEVERWGFSLIPTPRYPHPPVETNH